VRIVAVQARFLLHHRVANRPLPILTRFVTPGADLLHRGCQKPFTGFAVYVMTGGAVPPLKYFVKMRSLELIPNLNVTAGTDIYLRLPQQGYE
jgi:hypothetical protein